MLRKVIYIWLLVLTFICSTAYSAEKKLIDKKDLSAAQVDKAFDIIFEKQKQLTRLKAKVITEKKGGIFKSSKATWAYAYAQMPDKLLFVDRGEVGKNLPQSQSAIILIDGTFLWDVKPADSSGVREAEQIDMNNAGGRDINIAALLIGADVASGKELREYYDIAGALEKFADGSISYHFTLKTAPGKEKRKRKEIVDLWIEQGSVIPWKIASIRMTPKVNPLNPNAPTKMKKSTSVKYITELETNLSKKPLNKYPPERFFFGTIMQENPGIVVLDSKGIKVDKSELERDLKISRAHLAK